MDVKPYTVNVPQDILDDLQQRLTRTRWPDELPGSKWDYGANLAYMKELVTYWRNQFDWRAQERAINAFANFRADINGLGIHFIDERGKGPNPIPLILTHGWPGTFLEMLKLVPFLTDPANYGGDPADAFDVIVPSMPGYGFSDRILQPGPWHVHALWVKLMSGLGYERFGAYGSDWGASVTTELARCYPSRIIGIHLTTTDVAWPEPIPPVSELSKAERDFLTRMESRWQEDGGYKHLQRTRPQTLAYGLSDSPVGLAAWLVEKFRAWSDCDGNVERRFTKDELLTTVTVYWATETLNASMRDYYERQHTSEQGRQRGRIDVPTAVAMFPKDVAFPREWVERSYNLLRWTEIPHGGHFPAAEEPELLAADIRAFFRKLR